MQDYKEITKKYFAAYDEPNVEAIPVATCTEIKPQLHRKLCWPRNFISNIPLNDIIMDSHDLLFFSFRQLL